MSVTFKKQILNKGNGIDSPQAGDTVTMDYWGWFYEAGKPDNCGEKFDSSETRGEFVTKIGVGKVIKGWDVGVGDMTLGETAMLTIPGDMAYGARGFPGAIPPNADLVFKVKLKAINGKRAENVPQC